MIEKETKVVYVFINSSLIFFYYVTYFAQKTSLRKLESKKYHVSY